MLQKVEKYFNDVDRPIIKSLTRGFCIIFCFDGFMMNERESRSKPNVHGTLNNTVHRYSSLNMSMLQLLQTEKINFISHKQNQFATKNLYKALCPENRPSAKGTPETAVTILWMGFIKRFLWPLIVSRKRPLEDFIRKPEELWTTETAYHTDELEHMD